ncbi:MAG: hypothetical protein WC322_04695 [Candidatus Paceibacterota bacterium]|jgi:hypothetical protein
MANEKLLPANVTILLAYPEAFVNPLAPTAAELNAQFAWSPTASQGNMVFNVSCATLDDYTMNQTDSDTDDTRTVCDEGEVSNATYQNYEVSLDFLRDKSLTDQGLFNLAAELTRAPDRPLYAIKRIVGKNDTAFAIGDAVSIFGVTTDYPQDMVDSGELLKHGARFKPTGSLAVNYELAA